jgi:thioredoxin reductase (NADPH)
MDFNYDVVIVGGGPGGLCAGLYSARANLKTVLLEKLIPGGEIANTAFVEDYPGFELIGGPELAQKMEAHARRFGLEIKTETVVEIYSEGQDKIVKTDDNIYRAKAVILATGGSPNKLGIPGEYEYAGKGVSYCALCDGAFFKGEVIAVVGGGDAAVEEATFLTKFGSKVYIIHRREAFRAQKIIQDRAFANPKIEVIWNTAAEEIVGDGKKTGGIKLKNLKTGEAKTLPVGAVFIFIGFVPNSNLFREPVKKDKLGYIITNDRMETDIPGVYAIGDVRAQLCKQVTNAVGDGTTAAVAAQKYIESLKDQPAAARA